jgi:hypothetical protein
MSKLVILIMRSRYSYKKKIKTDYQTQFPTNPILNNNKKFKLNNSS